MTDERDAPGGTDRSAGGGPTDALDRGPFVLAGYALLQVFLLAFSYYAVTSLGLGSPGFMHIRMPWYLVLPGVWLLVLVLVLRSFVPRIRAASESVQ